MSEDNEFIDFINSEVLLDVKAAAIPYYEYDYTALLLEANIALSAVHNNKNELHEEVYRLHADVDGEWYYYVEHEASLTVGTLNKIKMIVSEACRVASDIYDALDVITRSDEDETIKVNDAYEELLSLEAYIEEVCCFDTLIELAEFDSNEFINEQLQEEFAMEAYEDNLENCIESASGEAMSRVWDLTQAAKEDVDILLNELEQYCKKYADYIENLRVREIKKISAEIDNT